jgi:hypothetical protein
MVDGPFPFRIVCFFLGKEIMTHELPDDDGRQQDLDHEAPGACDLAVPNVVVLERERY